MDDPTTHVAASMPLDRRALVLFAVLASILLLETVLGLSGSSIGIWTQALNERNLNAGQVLGTPKKIRADEWAVLTPAILSQAHQNPPFPTTNRSWGSASVPLVINVPVRHFSTLFRPQFWGYFLFDLERAHAFYWNMKAFILDSGVFLLLILLTGGDFRASLLGTAWVFLSGFTQWWFSSPALFPEMVGCFALVLVAIRLLTLAPTRKGIATGALLFAVCSVNFALCLYPPFQVPLFYLGLAILPAILGPGLGSGSFRRHLGFRLAAAASAGALTGTALLLYARDAWDTLARLRATVYPGARALAGGDVGLAQVFGGFFGFFMSEKSIPLDWNNVCEASNFVLLFPVPLACLAMRLVRRLKVSALHWGLLAYIAVLLSWTLWGWPRAIAVASGFSRVPGVRALLGLGLASILWCCVSLSERDGCRSRPPGWARIVLTGGFVALLALFAAHFNRSTGGFASIPQVTLVCAVAGMACFFLLGRNVPALAACVLIPNLVSYGLVNPITKGLTPITGSRLFDTVSRIAREDPRGRWTAYRSLYMADYIKAAGAAVFNGTCFVPPLEDLRVLDPGGLQSSTYNRLAHMILEPTTGTGIAFVQTGSADIYTIEIDPANEAWRRLGVRYAVLPYEATDERFLKLAAPLFTYPETGLWVYRYRWSLDPG
jgi:hypothetical protein